MQPLLSELIDRVLFITLNRMEKHNALNPALLSELHQQLIDAELNSEVNVIVLRANGAHFSAGADLVWMQQTASLTHAENQRDAMILAETLYAVYSSSKPTLAVVHGGVYGGGGGLVAACDLAIAAHSARFCFSEVTLGLIPAVISPYVIQAIGARATRGLFLSAESIDATRAHELGLIHQCVSDADLSGTATTLARTLSRRPVGAMSACKHLINDVNGRVINRTLIEHTADLIAQRRVSSEGQHGMQAFLHGTKPNWS